jgi:hypothetical protein
MVYAAVQFVGYEIFTGPGQNPQRYIGLDNDRDDMAARVALMREALAAAQASGTVERERAVLKVFVAPEFYFRGARGIYPVDLVIGARGGREALVPTLTDLVSDDIWSDWLVVFGSILVAKTGPDGRSRLYNLALVQKGGFRGEDERASKGVFVMRPFDSGIDLLSIGPQGLTATEISYLPSVGAGTYAAEENRPDRPDPYYDGTIFTLDGITFGLEGCLDHAGRRLLRAWPRKDDPFVQIQLVSSGGTSIRPASVATLAGGFVFNVDGLSSTQVGNGYGYHAECTRVRERLPEKDGILTVPPQGTVPVNRDLGALTRVFWLPPSHAGADPAARAPRLQIYPPLTLPPVGRAQ